MLEPQRPGDARQQLVLPQQRHAVHTLDVRHEVVICNGGREFNTYLLLIDGLIQLPASEKISLRKFESKH